VEFLLYSKNIDIMETERKKYVTYFRVSSVRQEREGISLEAQRARMRKYVDSVNGELIGEFTDTDSGDKRNRKGIMQAVDMAKSTNATLVVDELDRCCRDQIMAWTLRETKTENGERMEMFFLDFPFPMNDLVYGTIVNFAAYFLQQNRRKTKKAVAYCIEEMNQNGGRVVKKNGNIQTSWGNSGFGEMGSLGGKISGEVRRANRENDPMWRMAANTAREMRRSGDSYEKIAATLNSTGLKTRRGKQWTKALIRTLFV
jgi:DNA invertase Pin-like site-specific DNA recombinase